MNSNFQQFENSGNSWTPPGHFDREIEDAANPLCSTARRRSALEYVVRRDEDKNRTLCDFPQQPDTKDRPRTSEARHVALVLSIRNRMKAPVADDKPSLADWQRRGYVSTKKDPQTESQAEPKVKHVYDRKFLDPFRRMMSPSRRAVFAFERASDIIREFGSIKEFYNV